MTTIIRQVEIDAPVAHVWHILADFGNIYKFNPTVPRSYSTSTAASGVGATRHCDLRMGASGSVEERVVEWREGESYTIEIYEGKNTPPLAATRATLAVKAKGDKTVVTGTMVYQLKFGPIGFMMDQLMVKAQFTKAWGRLLAGLKHYAETGEEVGGELRVDMSAVLAPA